MIVTVLTIVVNKDCFQNIILVDQRYQKTYFESIIKVFVWKGKGATKEEKSGCMNKALQYMSAKGYGNNVQMEVVNDGAESALFRSCFASWKDAFAVSGSKQAPKQSNIAKVLHLFGIDCLNI